MNNNLLKYFLIIVSSLLLHFLNAQNFQRIDSLEISMKLAEKSEDKIKILLELSNEFKNNEAVKDETKEAIRRIHTDLKKSTEDEIWEEFELRFQQVHRDFYDKLMDKFPDLSPNEQRLCAFLRLNMSSKEISELTGQSPNALETARYRLRKKLGISNSQVNLITFLSTI